MLVHFLFQDRESITWDIVDRDECTTAIIAMHANIKQIKILLHSFYYNRPGIYTLLSLNRISQDEGSARSERGEK